MRQTFAHREERWGLDDAANLPQTGSVLVFDVAPGSAAAITGIRGTRQSEGGETALGDIITTIDNQVVSDGDDLTRLLDSRNVGDTVQVEIVRDGQWLTLLLRLLTASREQRRNEVGWRKNVLRPSIAPTSLTLERSTKAEIT